ncbi:MAG: ATP-dependent zinc metalloprotease FtsH [Francisellaceae bacterium]|nr:ATP-dependent zinc metalloprotease FtsH [Francisellaceae bacterium]MBT6538820.1 ATP-dependent zinc metalloprotease FtsH [Francisellaceae bacterium]
MNDMLKKNLIIWLILIFVVVTLFGNFNPKYHNQSKDLNYSQFQRKLERGEVSKITIDGQFVSGLTSNNERFNTYMPAQPQLIDINDIIRDYDVNVIGKQPEQQSIFMHIFISWFPIILFIGVWIFFMRQMQGGSGGKGAMSFGRSKARLLGEDQVKITFADVAGCEEAKNEVEELVDFLREPSKFHDLGGRIPSGVLLVGPPGTGKTLLAKAIAGEAKVPFFTISGSDFVEMFVGVGASRVRDMFEQAKKHAPCIIFIDEIDAVGRHRGSGMGGGHDEREQTLNQLLVEMDGFEGSEGVIVIAATNRPDVLDPALLRPGRFDRQVSVGLPDLLGREQILKVHMKKVPLDDSINIRNIARGTPGFSGADLSNLVNEAALSAARANRRVIGMEELEGAKDKILMGVERLSLVLREDERRNTAYHEAGHAIVGLCLPGHDPVYKVTIVPRSNALGVTMFVPEEDRYSQTKKDLYNRVKSLWGGRIAEEIIFGKDNVTTGAANDIQKATEICRNMVTRWGLSEKAGPLSFESDNDEVFVGRQMGSKASHTFSSHTAQLIDEEVKAIADVTYKDAKEILLGNLDKLHAMSDALMKYETVDAEQIGDIMNGISPREPKDWSKNSSSDQDSGTTEKGDDSQEKKSSGDSQEQLTS